MTMATLIKKTFNQGGLTYSFRGSVNYCHVGENGGVAGRGSAGAESAISCRQQEIDGHTGRYPEYMKPQSPPPQRHTSSN